MFDTDITLYNFYYDRDKDCNRYKRTHIRGVDFQGSVATKLSETKGLLSSDNVKLFIPSNAETEGKMYIKPKAYKRLSNDERNNYFTFNQGDKVVKGIIDFELTGEKPNNLKYLEDYYDDVFNIYTVSTRDYGSEIDHWEVGAK